MSPADPLHPKTRLGAIVSKEQLETVLSYVEAGKSEGAKLVCGGERADIGTGKGYFVKPTVFRRRRPADAHRPRGDLRPRPGHDPAPPA